MAEPCFYCGVPMTPKNWRPYNQQHRQARTTDHIVPQSKIGSQHARGHEFKWQLLNTVQVCFTCNNRKADMWPLDWLEVMPEYGVKKLAERLLRLGCEPEAIDLALAARDSRSEAMA